MKTNVNAVWGFTVALGAAAWAGAAERAVVCPADAAPQMRLAAKEVARYVYLRTGTLPAVAAAADGSAIALSVDTSLGAESYTLKTEGAVTRVTGGDAVGVEEVAARHQ